MQHQDMKNIAVAPEIGGHSHMELRRVHVRQIVETERRLMTVDAQRRACGGRGRRGEIPYTLAAQSV